MSEESTGTAPVEAVPSVKEQMATRKAALQQGLKKLEADHLMTMGAIAEIELWESTL